MLQKDLQKTVVTNPDDVNFVVGTYNTLSDIDKIKNNPYVWVVMLTLVGTYIAICSNYVLDGVTGGTDSFTLIYNPTPTM